MKLRMSSIMKRVLKVGIRPDLIDNFEKSIVALADLKNEKNRKAYFAAKRALRKYIIDIETNAMKMYMEELEDED
jgi:hypothetical protein